MEKLLQPKDLAKKCGINKSTLNGYLKDKDMFPPVKIDQENGYRYYPESTISALNLFKALRKKPYRLREYEIKKIFMELDINHMIDLHLKSKNQLFDYLRDNNRI